MRKGFSNGKKGVGGLLLLAVLAAVVVIAVPGAFANAGDPDSTQATWHYVSGTSGPVDVNVTGRWSWGDNSLKGGGKDAQSCASGKTVSSTNVGGHEALGIAVSWNDSSTPNTLTGKATDGSTVTLHLGNSMDWTNASYCAGTTVAAPYPSGTFNATHRYASLAAFQSDTTNGRLCANAYDVHKVGDAKENDPAQNGDNTLKNGHYSLGVDCATARDVNPPPPTTTTTTTSPPPPPPTTTTTPTPPPTPVPGVAIQKVERLGGTGTFVTGPVSGHVGQTVFYQMLVRNSGQTTLTVTLSDPRCDTGTLAPTGAHTLASGDTLLYTCSHVLLAGDRPVFVNTATADGRSVSASSSVTATSSVTADVLGGVKGAVKTIKVTKKAKPARPVVKAASFTG